MHRLASLARARALDPCRDAPRRHLHPLIVFAGARTARRVLLSHHNRTHAALALGALLSGVALYVYTKSERAPVTGRRQLMLVSRSELAEHADTIETLEGDQRAEWIAEGYDFEEETSERTRRVERIVRSLVSANMELAQLSSDPLVHWNFTVVTKTAKTAAKRDVQACVTVTGGVYVFEGMFDVARSDSELATVLAHELAHVTCAHALEEANVTVALEKYVIYALAGLLGFDGIAAMFSMRAARSLVSLSYSRTCETEADFVGLEFLRQTRDASGAPLYDESATLSVWRAFSEVDSKRGVVLPTVVSTHPDSDARLHNFYHWLREPDLREYARKRHGHVSVDL